MLHLRIVAPSSRTADVTNVLQRTESVYNLVVLRDAAIRPAGDVVLCDVAREDASVVLADLRALGIHHTGPIAVEGIDTALSDGMDRAVLHARGSPADAVVWEEVGKRTSESSELSVSFALFMVLSALIAAVGIFLDSSILIVGAMVVGPEFGPIAGVCVAMVQGRRDLARRSALALAVGFALAIACVVLAALAFQAGGAVPDEFDPGAHELAALISKPDFFAFFVAFCAGIAGMLSLTTAKSAALIGVFISITTIPAAADAGIAASYGDWSACRGALGQLVLNLGAILLSGTLTLVVQRLLYRRRRMLHLARVGGSQPSPRERAPSG